MGRDTGEQTGSRGVARRGRPCGHGHGLSGVLPKAGSPAAAPLGVPGAGRRGARDSERGGALSPTPGALQGTGRPSLHFVCGLWAGIIDSCVCVDLFVAESIPGVRSVTVAALMGTAQ